MKSIITTLFTVCMFNTIAQPVPPPIEQRHPISYWWWIIGVLLALGAGIGLYMLIKKDPKKDAV